MFRAVLDWWLAFRSPLSCGIALLLPAIVSMGHVVANRERVATPACAHIAIAIFTIFSIEQQRTKRLRAF